MELDPEFIIRFAHDAMKPMKTFRQMLVTPEIIPTELQTVPIEFRETWAARFGAAQQVMEDFQTLASCATNALDSWESFDWRDMVENEVKSLRKNFTGLSWERPDHEIPGWGDPSLLKTALYDIRWFVTHFANHLDRMAIKESSSNSVPAVELVYTLQTAIELGEMGRHIIECEPFAPMSKQSLTIEHNTGLMLFVVKQIMAKHRGEVAISIENRVLTIRLLIPKKERVKAQNAA
jgi:hypothetical protein